MLFILVTVRRMNDGRILSDESAAVVQIFETVFIKRMIRIEF